MTITTYSGIYTGRLQEITYTKTVITGSSATDPTVLWVQSGRPGGGTVGSNLAGRVPDNTETAALPFPDPPAGQNTYISRFKYNSALLGTTTVPRSMLLIDLMWISSAVSQVTTTQTINSIAWPARDVDGSTAGKGVYIALLHTGAYSAPNSYTATITYTNSAGTGSKTGTVSRTGGNLQRWAPLSLDNGDVGVQSIQDFTFSALPGTGGGTVLFAYRPIAMISSQFTQGLIPIDETAMTLALPRLYNGTCVTMVTFAGGTGANETFGSFTLSQG